MRLRIILSAIFAFILGGKLAFAQTAWVRDKHELFASIAGQYFTSNNFYNALGESIETTQFTQFGGYFYGEFGLTERLTVIADFPFIKFQGFETTNFVAGIGDLTLGLKYGIAKGSTPIAITIAPEIPLGNSNLYAVNKLSAFETINLPTGDGEFNLHTKLAISHSFYPKQFYFSAFGDYNLRTHYGEIQFRDQIIAGIEAGYSYKGSWLIYKTGIQKTIGKQEGFTEFVRGEGTDYSYHQIEMTYPLSKTLTLGARAVFQADFPVELNNIYVAPTFGLSLSYKGMLKKQPTS